MPPKKEKEAFIVLLDIGNNTAVRDESGRTFLDKSKDCLSKIIQRKLFNSSADEFGLILIGSKNSKNKLFDECEDQYQNIEIVTNLSLASWDLLKYVHNVTNSSCVADWLDAIIVTIQYIAEQTQTKDFIQVRIVMLSNCSQEICDDNLDVIVKKMKSQNIGIVVLGPDVLNDTDEGNLNTQRSQVIGVRLVTQLVTELDGTICAFEDALPEVMYFQRKTVTPMAWNSELIISEKIKIPISGYKKTAELTPLKWLNESIDNKDASVLSERKYVKYDLKKRDYVEVEGDDVINGYPYIDKPVACNEADKKVMSFESGKKGLYLLHCTQEKRVPRYMLLGNGSYLITGRKNDESSAVCLEAFILALHKANKVGIAKKLYYNNSTPSIGALFPVVTDEQRYLTFCEIPFKDDENICRLPSLKKVQPRTEEQSKAVSCLIDSMDLDESDNMPEKYDPMKTYDPHEQYLYHCITYKALHPDEPLPDNKADTVKHMLEPLPEIARNSEHAVKLIKDLFPLTVVEKKKKKINSAYHNGQEQVENDVGYGTEIIEKVGTENPVDDFMLIVKQGTNHTEACQSMQDAIVSLLSSCPDEIKKPLASLKALRESCISENPKMYNSWLFIFKDFIRQKSITSLWDAVISLNLGLITQHESDKSDVSLSSAEEFLKDTSTTDSGIMDDNFDDLFSSENMF